MNIFELFILYLACGAPFGVYYFLQNNGRLDSRQLWLKTILNFLFWLPKAFVLLKNFYSSNSSSLLNFDFLAETDSNRSKLSLLQREIENSLTAAKAGQSLFAIREVLDRYAGLTIELKNFEKIPMRMENDFFKIVNEKDAETALLCNQRRNLKLLSFHQKLAADDFLKLLSDSLNDFEVSPTLMSVFAEFAAILQDSVTQEKIADLLCLKAQTPENIVVPETENFIWKTEQHKPLQPKPLSIPFQTMKATNLSTKD